MSLMARRPPKDTSLALAFLGLAATLAVIRATEALSLADALLGLMLLLIAGMYRGDVPRGFAARFAFAMVRGIALWLLLAAPFYAALTDPVTVGLVSPYAEQARGWVAERYWFPIGWIVFSILFWLVLSPRPEGPRT